MNDNKYNPLSKKIRFEVFKRDSFSCVYCGKSPPNVILEVDHIIPKSQGGTNDIINLATSCFDCNRGKSDRLINDKIARADIQADIEKLKEINEQVKEYYNYQNELDKLNWQAVEKINDLYKQLTGGLFCFGEYSKMKYFRLLKQFNVDEVLEATMIAFDKFGDDLASAGGFKYTCGILHNWKRNGRAVF